MARPHPDKMTFLEHLEELRQRLVRAAIYLAVGFAACWGFREQIFHFMTQPMRKAGYTEAFIFTSPAEALMLYMKMAFFVGIFVAAPSRPLGDLGLHLPRPLQEREGLGHSRSSGWARPSSSSAPSSATTSSFRTPSGS